MRVGQLHPRNKTGLRSNLLGKSEYNRQWYRQRNPVENLTRPHWTGLSFKLMGPAAYMKAWREKRKERTA